MCICVCRPSESFRQNTIEGNFQSRISRRFALHECMVLLKDVCLRAASSVLDASASLSDYFRRRKTFAEDRRLPLSDSFGTVLISTRATSTNGAFGDTPRLRTRHPIMVRPAPTDTCCARDLCYWKGKTRPPRRRGDSTCLFKCVSAISRILLCLLMGIQHFLPPGKIRGWMCEKVRRLNLAEGPTCDIMGSGLVSVRLDEAREASAPS